MNQLPLLLAVFAVLELFIGYFLIVLNMNETLRNSDKIPSLLADIIDEGTYRKSQNYTLTKSRFAILVKFVSTSFLLIVLLTRLPGLVHGLVLWLNLPGLLTGLFFLTVLVAGSGLLSLPVSLYRIFVIEEQFGFNKMTPGLFFSDLVKQGILSLFFMSVLFTGIYYLEYFAGNLWWLYAWGFYTVFQILVLLIYPVFIAPLFNKFSPLEEGPHKEAVQELADRCGFRHKNILVMDGSRRSSHGNAYFTGFGNARRIVFFDTLLNEISPEEMAAILAHEIGHYKKGHLVQRIVAQTVMSLIAFAAFAFCLKRLDLFPAFGFSGSSLEGMIVISLLVVSPLSLLTTPLSNLVSRKHEYAADNYAVLMTGSGKGLSSALKKLGKNNLSHLTPHPLYSGYHYSHPGLNERLKNLDRNSLNGHD